MDVEGPQALLRAGPSQLLPLPAASRAPCLCCQVVREPSTQGVFSLELSNVLSNDYPEFNNLTPIQKRDQEQMKLLPTSYHGDTSGSGL